MKKLLFFLLIMIFIINQLNPGLASAYSYGDPSEEKVAEAYKEMVIKLNEEPPNFGEAKKIFDSVKEEIAMHMGSEPTSVIEKDFENENKEAIIKDYEKILVLNIARRMESIEKNFNDYDTGKKLLAKAFATYEAISPNVQGENAEKDKSLRDAFDKSLEALGNPGLFGVGQKESDPDAFKEHKEFILKELQEQFKLESLDVGHFSESATEQEQSAGGKGGNDWTDRSSLKNWLPIAIIAALIAGAVIYAVRKRKR